MNYTNEKLNILIDSQFLEEIVEIENLIKKPLTEEEKAILKHRISTEIYLWYE